ncbi:MAG: hypothetical protein F6K42_30855, partial [Leptolyngbya sp. SIO1D8]|nr:hypothetical protein [Leptolyngbya sp. SIO1D8]
MSEANVPANRNPSRDLDALARADQVSAQSQLPLSSNEDGWEAVPLPGILPVDSIPHAPEPAPPTPEVSSSREIELLTLIQDLNRCNEVLLARVNQLEEALETSQRALQQEVERSQKLTEEDRVAAAQQYSVAQLLSELEQSNAALKRQTILAETLQAQIETSQERSSNLERECLLLQKRYAEKTQKLQEVDETCRDLKSRLQRQQRYTLQFKAALEKSLDTSAFNQATAGTHSESAPEPPPPGLEAAISSNPLAMPRSERIQPWSSTETAAHADPQLLSLVRSINEPETPTPNPESSHSVAASPAVTAELITAGEAEKQLWQDVERVIESSAPTTEPTSQTVDSPAQSSPATEEVQFTEPLPWGAPIQKAEAVTASTPPSKPENNELSTPVGQTAHTSTPEPPPAISAEILKAEAVRTSASQYNPPITTEIPALDAARTSQASPSPIVHPLRP